MGSLQPRAGNDHDMMMKEIKEKLYLINIENVTDIYGSAYTRKILERNDNIYSLTSNTDGVAIVHSNCTSLWPVLIKFEILSEGIFVRKIFCNIFITNAAIDLPAKCDVAKMVQFNSKHACNFCLQEGQSTSQGIRYTYKVQLSTVRTHDSIVQDMIRVNSHSNLILRGIKVVSPMIAFDQFDLSKSFPIDHIHCVLLGVTKKIIGFRTESKYHKCPFYINKVRTKILNCRLLKIKTPSYISRRPRSSKYFHSFKASELRNLLIYYIPTRWCIFQFLEK